LVAVIGCVLGVLYFSSTESGTGEGAANPELDSGVVPAAIEREAIVDAGPPLRLGLRIYHDEAEVRRRHMPLAEYLTREVGRHFMLVTDEHYIDMAQALRQGQFEFASLSAIEFVEAEAQIPGLIALGKPVNANGISHYSAVILTRTDDDIRTFDALRGRRFCFVSERSTSGYRVPRVMLRQNGIDPASDFSERHFEGNHADTLERLRRGGCDAASVYRNMWEQAEDAGNFHPLSYFGPIPNEQYVAHPSVDPEVVERVRAALLRLVEGSEAADRVFGPHPQREYFAPHRENDHAAARELIEREREFGLEDPSRAQR